MTSTTDRRIEIAAEIAHLRDVTTTREQFVNDVVPLYREDPVEVARICDEEIDRRGHLLGYLRAASLALPSFGVSRDDD